MDKVLIVVFVVTVISSYQFLRGIRFHGGHWFIRWFCNGLLYLGLGYQIYFWFHKFGVI